MIFVPPRFLFRMNFPFPLPCRLKHCPQAQQDDDEQRRVAASGAVVAPCVRNQNKLGPTTHQNGPVNKRTIPSLLRRADNKTNQCSNIPATFHAANATAPTTDQRTTNARQRDQPTRHPPTRGLQISWASSSNWTPKILGVGHERLSTDANRAQGVAPLSQ